MKSVGNEGNKEMQGKCSAIMIQGHDNSEGKQSKKEIL